ncbi:LacI family DNA-binding transcriptional regulator [Culturomica massiliensis]|jgi:DNA-binding LacI/PurR family transcriptional regulator|uniref:LacI family DNA-binding transcriptional regulator n=1 Tax=Culturomica massiliensis TaxID=1841857 RepID=UPI000E55B0FB|nr:MULTISPECIES: LacI family DNA-binding transcriptional regulator [Odoribacteraceae]RHV93075.1 LacI family transcriptional regulator [Odoribacter sp. OF09-27XD]
MQVTLKELAERLKLAPSTVSRALKGHPDISEETQLRVRRLAEELHYAPNVMATNLRCQKSNFIAVVVPEIRRDFYAAFVNGAEKIFRENGYFPVLFQSCEDFRQEEAICRSIGVSRMGGVLVSVAQTTHFFQHFYSLQEQGIPLLFFDRIAGELDTDRVITDDFMGAYEVVRHLIVQGYRKIVHYAGVQHLQVAQKRRLGYLQALQDFHIPVEEDMIVYCNTAADVSLYTPQLMQSLAPDALFAVDDDIAVEVLSVLKEMGYRIPDDLAVCGFSGDNITKVTEPGLTSVDRHAEDMGEISARLLLERIQMPHKFPTVTKMIKPALVVRKSTERPVRPLE